jgi:hypothetical protein
LGYFYILNKETVMKSEVLSLSAPSWGILSMTVIPMLPLCGALAIIVTQQFVGTSGELSADYFSRLSQMGVLVQMALMVVGVIASLTSIIKREHPRSPALLGLIANILLIIVFLYARFYALGFDQDTGAPPL